MRIIICEVISTDYSKFKEELLAKVDLVSFLSKYIFLQKKGRNHWACCPFHGEKTPSFAVNEEGQYYHCFGCGKTGNAISFLIDYQKLTYVEAIKELANIVGLKVPEEEETPAQIEARKERARILALVRETAMFYLKNLYSEKGVKAAEYLLNRGFSQEVIKKFALGCSNDYYSLPNHLQKCGYSLAEMLKGGVVARSEKGVYDFLGERLIVPIINAKSEVIGFGGRIYEKKAFGKYKNTEGTILFEKRKTLFAVNFLRKELKNLDYAILVEGYMDVIALYQSGITNVVASMGTALTVDQCKTLKKYVKKVIVSFDGDAAGQNATMRSLDLLTAEGLEVRVVEIPDGLDPDEVIAKNGVDFYKNLIEKAPSLTEFKLKKLESTVDMNSIDGKNVYAKKAITILEPLDDITLNQFVDLVSQKTSIDNRTIANSVANSKILPINKKKEIAKEESSAVTVSSLAERAALTAIRFVLSSIFAYKAYVMIEDIQEQFFRNEIHRKIYMYIKNCIDTLKQPKIGDIIDDVDIKEELEIIINAVDKIEKTQQELYYKECINKLKKQDREQSKKKLVAAIQSTADPEEKKKLEQQLLQLIKT